MQSHDKPTRRDLLDSKKNSKHLPLASVVVLSWNGGKDIFKCVKQISKQSYPNIELIIVDNGSTDGSLSRLEKNFHINLIIRNHQNLGYAEGMNQGIKCATGQYILLQNQDAFISKDYIEHGVKAFNESKDVGLLAAMVKSVGEGKEGSINRSFGMHLRKWMKPVANSNKDATYVLGPIWCSTFIRKKVFDDCRCPVSGDILDETYFAYHEDVDFNLRAVLQGWKCKVVPKMEVQHVGSGTFKGKVGLISKPPAFRSHAFKNRYLTAIKNIPTALLIKWFGYFIFFELVLYLYLLFKAPMALKDLFNSYLDLFHFYKLAIKKRKYIQANRKIPIDEFERYFL